MSYEQLRIITEDKIERSDKSPPKDTNETAKVISVYDGDTCDLVVIMGQSLERFKCRLADIDSPEMPKKELKESDPEKYEIALKRAEKSRDFLAWLCTGNVPQDFPSDSIPWSKDELQKRLDASKTLIYAEFQGIGGFQRPLITLRKSSGARDSFNDLLMQYGYAEKYRR